MSYKEITRSFYDINAQVFSSETEDYLQQYLLPEINLFLGNIPGKKILDLGSGSGRDASEFKQRGFNPVCVDISREMISLCKQKGLESYVMDMENLQFSVHFDGVWAYTSLLHIPKKNITSVLSKVDELLVEKGVFYCGMREGSFEGFEKNSLGKRYVSLYRKEEFEDVLSEKFNVLHFSRIVSRPTSQYINFLCTKK